MANPKCTEMSTNIDLDAIFRNYNNMSREILDRPIVDNYRNIITRDIGGAWESLGTFIGLSSGDIDDIKEECKKPLDRRLAMMRRWHELWGKEATYLKLAEGLRQIGRRDLIEKIIDSELNTWNLPATDSTKYKLYFFPWNSNDIVKLTLMVVFFTTVIVSAIIFPRLSGSPYHNTSSTEKYYRPKHTLTHPHIIQLNERRLRNCSLPESDLPVIHPLFVGRENDMNQVLHRVASAHIVNINGAPGFGKSTLAIHVGYEILKNGSSVRYINIEDKVFSIVYEHQKSKGKPISEGTYKAHQTHQSSLIELSRSSLSSLTSQILSRRNENLFEELLRWSESINCTYVLILDNCDDILITSSHHKFLSLINSLVIKSSFKLHVIIVSRERLLYLDSFDHWTVRELNQSASIQLLDKIAPAFDNESLREVAELVEGCPLALKVIGQLLHINGAQLFHKLKKEFLTTLDKVSVPEQRFRVILDVAFNRLGALKDCGYVLSLFPGSFDEGAGSAIVQNECLETYLKHSLLNEYSFAFNHHYKMHRVIKEYLQEKNFYS